MENYELKCFCADTELTDYMPVPRGLMGAELPSTAVLIYGALLDRGTLSRKNHYADEDGWVYVIYPVGKLAEAFRISDTAVKNHLRVLERQGFIRRRREKEGGASRIFLKLPTASIKVPESERKLPPGGEKTSPVPGRKVPPNNVKQQPKCSNYYQHGEDESL